MTAHITGKEMGTMSRAVKDIQVIGIKAVSRLPYISRAQMMHMFNMSSATVTRRIADLVRYVQSAGMDHTPYWMVQE